MNEEKQEVLNQLNELMNEKLIKKEVKEIKKHDGKANLEKSEWFLKLVNSGEFKVYENGLVTDKNGKDIRIMPGPTNTLRYGIINKRDPITKKVRQITIHRLIWIVFKGIPQDDTLQINHLDGIKTNNNLNNLELTTSSKNQKHSYEMGLSKVSDKQREDAKRRFTENNPTKKVTNQEVINMRNEYSSYILDKKEIMDKYGLSRHAVEKILKKETFKDLEDNYDINIYYKRSKRLSEFEVIEIRNKFNSDELSKKEIMDKYKISKGLLNDLLTGETFLNVPGIDIEKYNSKNRLYKNKK